jgi:hypothetical protein
LSSLLEIVKLLRFLKERGNLGLHRFWTDYADEKWIQKMESLRTGIRSTIYVVGGSNIFTKMRKNAPGLIHRGAINMVWHV